jgi:hypothetical protein
MLFIVVVSCEVEALPFRTLSRSLTDCADASGEYNNAHIKTMKMDVLYAQKHRTKRTRRANTALFHATCESVHMDIIIHRTVISRWKPSTVHEMKHCTIRNINRV